MATNWTISEAVKVIRKGTNKEAIKDIAKKFPFLFAAICKMNEPGLDLLESFNEKITARKINNFLCGDDDDDTETDEELSENEKAAVEAAKERKARRLSKKRKVKASEVEETEDDEDEDEAPKKKKGKKDRRAEK